MLVKTISCYELQSDEKRKELINGILLTKHLKYNSKMTVRTATISTSTDLIKVIKYLSLEIRL